MNGATFDVLNKAKTTLMKKGFVPIPAHPADKHPLGKWKSYKVSDWSKSLKLAPGARANIGVLTGTMSGIMVLDIDNRAPESKNDKSNIYSKNTGMHDWQVLCEEYGEPNTLKCTTPSGGMHYYFMWDEDLAAKVKTTNSKVMSVDDALCGIDLRGDGGFIMCPPSIVKDRCYSWQPSDKINDVSISTMPEWIKDNILHTCGREKHRKHHENLCATFRQPCANDAVSNEDFELFKRSPLFHNHEFVKVDDHQRIIMIETEDFNCSICVRRHKNHSNHPFIVRRGENLLFVCRPSVGDKHFTALVYTKRNGDEGPDEEKDTPHFKLIKEVWNYSKELGLMKRDGWVYMPIKDKPCAYRPYLEYNAFLNKVLQKSKSFKSGPKRMKDLLLHLELYDDIELPFMVRDMNILAFQNGVLFLDSLNFVEYGEEMEGKIARHFVDQHFSGSNHTPVFDKFIMHQLAALEQEEQLRVYEMLLMLMGRTFFRTGQFDKFTVMLFLYGDSNTGKTTLLRILEAMHPRNAIGIIGANTEKTFGVDGLMDKDIVVIPEMPHNMRDILDCTLFQQMVDGDMMTCPGKHRKVTFGTFTPPIIGAGNKFPNYSDKKGAIPKRLATMHFDQFVTERDNSLEKLIIDNELPNLIFKSLKAYWKVINENKTKDFWDISPLYFQDTKELAKTATNWLHRFLTASPDENKSTTARHYVRKRVLPGEMRFMMPIGDVKKAFLNYMKFNHPEEKIQWEDGDHATFKSLGYEILTVNVCRSCGQKAKGGKTKCCPEYDGKANRSKKVYVCDLEIVNEALPYKETPMGKKNAIDGSFEYV